jgi:hypothetical protein
MFNWEGTKYLSEMLGKFLGFVPNLVSALVILIIGIFYQNLFRKSLKNFWLKLKLIN